jgi:hypothetical protein
MQGTFKKRLIQEIKVNELADELKNNFLPRVTSKIDRKATECLNKYLINTRSTFSRLHKLLSLIASRDPPKQLR